MFELPTSLVVDDVSYKITNRGDFRMVLDCFSALNDAELDERERVLACLIIFYEDLDSLEDVLDAPIEKLAEAMFKFFNCGNDNQEELKSPKLIDWEQDEQLICSAVNNVARTEVRALKYLHWWTFLGYYLAIGESPLASIVSIRHKLIKNKKLETHEREFMRENPSYFNWNFKSTEEIEAFNWVSQQWNRGSD